MHSFSALTPPVRLLRAAWLALFALVFAVGLSACGGGGVIPGTGVTLRSLPSDFGTRKAVAYSPFRSANRDTETVTTAEITQDLNLLVQGGYGLIRVFDSSTIATRPNGGSTEAILQVIQANQLNIKVQLGIYVVSKDTVASQAEIARGIQLATTYPSVVDAVSVGNETMVNWSFNAIPVATMAQYIKTVRTAVTQPVTTDDNWLFFSGADTQSPTLVLNQIDFVSMHSYALLDTVSAPGSWDWQQRGAADSARAAAMMDAAITWTQANFNAVRSYLDKNGFASMPVTIGETGWKAVATGAETYRAHPVNQAMYIDRLAAWSASTSTAKPTAIIYFEAFDEPWKGGDDGWGLFNVSRQARWVLQTRNGVTSAFPSSQWAPGSYTLADALYYVAPVSNPTITANRYTVFADQAVAGEAKPTVAVTWTGFNSPATAFAGTDTSTFAPGDGPSSLKITPAPQNANPMFGWGLIGYLPSSSDDLSNFTASGSVNFSIHSTYPGKIQVGFLTGSTTNSNAVQAYVVIDPSVAQYGYVNDGAWHNVSIPVSALVAAATPAYGQPASAKLDMTQVTQPFTVADLYGSTGKTSGSPGYGDTTTFWIDNVYWSK